MQGHSAFWFARGLRRNGLMASLIRVENVAGKGARAVEARVNETKKNYKIFALHRYVENRSNKYALKIR